MGKLIRLHPKHGLNPTTTNCFFCGEAKDILLVGTATKKFKEAGLADADGQMHHSIGVVDYEPCQKCKEYMRKGVILISVRDGEFGKNPYRTGGWAVVKDEFIKGLNPPEFVADILQQRVAFVPDEAWNMLGLPRG